VEAPSGYPGYHQPAEISVTAPISLAIDHTKRMLFPVKLGRWFSLGFVAWLAHLGEGGSSLPQLPDTSGSGGGGPSMKPGVDWVIDHLSLVIIIGVAAIAFGTAITALLLWLSSRAKFMFIDDIVKNEDKVEEPWKRFAELGSSLFKFRFVLSLLGLGVVLLALGVFLGMAWDELRTGVLAAQTLIAAVIAISIAIVLGAPLGIVGLLVDDFVVPAMYLNDEGVGAGWRRVKSEIFQGRGGTIFLFYLMQIALGLVIGVIAFVATCITLCIAALPYIGTVILLPLFVFSRAYVLYFVQQFGPSWQLFPRDPAEPAW
jgi:hypothetical protein